MTFKEAVSSDNYSYQVITTEEANIQDIQDWEVNSAKQSEIMVSYTAEKYLAVKWMNYIIT